MMHFLKSKTKILLMCAFIGLSMSACSAPRGSDGRTKADQIIASEEMTFEAGQVNVDDISNEEIKAEFEKELEETGKIVIEPTTWKSAFSRSWFDGLIVWPIAQLINVMASWTDAGFGIILATLLIQLVIFLLTFKSQAGSQRMQELQPEIQRIQNKYAGKNDQQSQMMMATETQKLYAENDIHPFGSLLITFIQLPIMMGMYYATMRASSVVVGSFLGMSLSETPISAFQNMQIGPIVVYILMIVFQILNLKLPQWLKKWQDKKDNVKQKKYTAKEQENNMMGSMNTMMYFSTALIAVMYISWPIAMTFYWMVSSIIRAIQQVIMHFVGHNNDKKRKAAKQNEDYHSILKR
jgi:YidC/Oxa1 family membrane protein insertase